MRIRTSSLFLAVLIGGLGCAGTKALQYQPDTTTISPGHQMENPPNWYSGAVIYQVWVKAFADGINSDGIGDLPGVDQKLDYLQSLGINTIWLSPIFECAYKGDNMHGYDTTDYYSINDRFGQQADLQKLIDDVHARGMRIIFDFVPNHTSSSHKWFTDGTKRNDWYIWQPSPPSGWGLPWGGGTSTDVWHPSNGNYFYSPFGSGMADLNYYNPDVKAAIQNVERYWLDRGFDGMRMDAVRYLCETGPGAQADQPETHARLREFRTVLDEYASGDAHPHPGNDPSKHSVKMMIAEAWMNGPSEIAQYYGNGSNEFNMCLDFSAPWAICNAIKASDATQLTGLWEFEQGHYPTGYRSATFDSNHDNLISRPGTLYNGQKNQIILHEALNILSPGTPILYYGNEIGMAGKSGNDLDLRQPMDWNAAAAQAAQPDSILSWCKYLIKARTTYKALTGAYSTLSTDVGPSKAIAYVMKAEGEAIFIVANLTGTTQSVTVSNLTTQGIPSGSSISAIIGDLKSNHALSGSNYSVKDLPPYGLRVLYATGGSFGGTIHGDLP